jgi:hypothetical protein
MQGAMGPERGREGQIRPDNTVFAHDKALEAMWNKSSIDGSVHDRRP